MVDHFLISVLVGTVLGFLSGLGTGGGSLLILWLTLVLHMEPDQARLINLMFFLPSASIASFLNWRKGGIPAKKLLLPILAGCLMAGIFTTVAKNMDTQQLRKLFGVLLIFTGIRELRYRPRAPK